MNYQPIYEFSDLNIEQTVCGPLNRNLALLEDELGLKSAWWPEKCMPRKTPM